MKLNMTTAGAAGAQMELGLGAGRGRSGGAPRAGHSARAGWWFERMRQIVDSACDYEPAPPQPEYTGFGDRNRAASGRPAAVRPAAEERQVVE